MSGCLHLAEQAYMTWRSIVAKHSSWMHGRVTTVVPSPGRILNTTSSLRLTSSIGFDRAWKQSMRASRFATWLYRRQDCCCYGQKILDTEHYLGKIYST